jgi:pimeloyl-ACP methyl ester carboxylesterase
MSNVRTHKKRTTVRARGIAPRASHWLVRRCPRLGALVLAELAMAPRSRQTALQPRSGDAQTELWIGRRRIRIHTFGEGPLVLLLHGWQGGASQLRSLAEVVASAGFRVALFDMPAHGEAPGWSTSGPEFVRLLRQVAAELGPLHALVGHGLGGMAALKCAAQGMAVQGVVGLAPIPSFEFALRQQARAYGLSATAQELLARRFEARTCMKRDELDLAGLDLAIPVLLVHDLLDRAVPHRHSRRLKSAWRSAHLVETCGFGHGRLLDADLVAQTVVAFLATLPGAPGTGASSKKPRTSSSASGSASLGQRALDLNE